MEAQCIPKARLIWHYDFCFTSVLPPGASDYLFNTKAKYSLSVVACALLR